MLANQEQSDVDRRELHDLYHQKEARDQIKYLKQMEMMKISNPERYRREVAKRMSGKRGSHTSTLTNLCIDHADECKRLQKKFSAIESELAALEEAKRHENYSTTDLINHHSNGYTNSHSHSHSHGNVFNHGPCTGQIVENYYPVDLNQACYKVSNSQSHVSTVSQEIIQISSSKRKRARTKSPLSSHSKFLNHLQNEEGLSPVEMVSRSRSTKKSKNNKNCKLSKSYSDSEIEHENFHDDVFAETFKRSDKMSKRIDNERLYQKSNKYNKTSKNSDFKNFSKNGRVKKIGKLQKVKKETGAFHEMLEGDSSSAMEQDDDDQQQQTLRNHFA